MTHKQHCLSSLTKNGNLNSVENSNILTISSLSSTVDHAVLTIKVSKYKNQYGGQEGQQFCSAAKAHRERQCKCKKESKFALILHIISPIQSVSLSLESVVSASIWSGEVLNGSSFCFISRRSSSSSSLMMNKKTRWPPAKM